MDSKPLTLAQLAELILAEARVSAITADDKVIKILVKPNGEKEFFSAAFADPIFAEAAAIVRSLMYRIDIVNLNSFVSRVEYVAEPVFESDLKRIADNGALPLWLAKKIPPPAPQPSADPDAQDRNTEDYKPARLWNFSRPAAPGTALRGSRIDAGDDDYTWQPYDASEEIGGGDPTGPVD